jgi:hypothetical protein
VPSSVATIPWSRCSRAWAGNWRSSGSTTSLAILSPGRSKYQNLLAKGQTVLVSMDATTSYASIAAGQKDVEIMAFLQAVIQAAIRYHHLGSIYISFQHEPDSVHTAPSVRRFSFFRRGITFIS